MVPTPGVTQTELTVLVPAERPELAALGESYGVARPAANVHYSTLTARLTAETQETMG